MPEKITDVPEMSTPQEAPEEMTSMPMGAHQETQEAPVDEQKVSDPDFSTLKIGDRKHFVLQDGFSEGQCRPFDIVNFEDQSKGLVNGRVLTDAVHDYQGAGQDGLFIENCGYDVDHKPGSWHEIH